MSTIDRVRLRYTDGEIAVRDYAFSQICEMVGGLTDEDRKIFWKGEESVTTVTDTHFAPSGTNLKYVGPV